MPGLPVLVVAVADLDAAVQRMFATNASSDSNCGHEYGTHLTTLEKKTLQEYLKTL